MASSDPALAPSTTLVRTSKLCSPADGDVRNPRVASGGALLKWMDSTACLAAERLSRCPSVTANMDDLEFFAPVEVGSIVLLESRVTRVFNTSMEVSCTVEVENLNTGERQRVCSTAYFTFVSLDRDGKKVKLPSVVPVTKEEKQEYDTAEMRRNVRLTRKQKIKDTATILQGQEPPQAAPAAGEAAEALPSSVTVINSTELVFVNQTNHHGTLFGGQVMEWMCNAATMASARLRSGFCTLRSIDDVYFVAPAKAGDRVLIRAQVNNTFSSSLEVGVRIEAYPVDGGEMRHINSGFLTLVAVDLANSGAKKTLPKLTFDGPENMQRSREATARRKIRLDRRAVRLRHDDLAIPWDDSKSGEMHLQNISALTILRGRTGWHKVAEEEGIRMLMIDEGAVGAIIRLDGVVQTPATRLFKLLSNMSLRLQWDQTTETMKLVRRVDEHCSLVYQTMKPFRRAKPDRPGPNAFDLALMSSVRMPTALSPAFVIAYRSVVTPEIPVSKDFVRAELGSTGFIITPVEGNAEESHVIYINTMGNAVLRHISSDLIGSSHVHLKTFLRVREVSESLKRQTRLPSQDEAPAADASPRTTEDSVGGCRQS